jgi:hypothetical protein
MEPVARDVFHVFVNCFCVWIRRIGKGNYRSIYRHTACRIGGEKHHVVTVYHCDVKC